MRTPDLEIDLLRAFVAVLEAGSFTAASAPLGRSQSTVSQKVLRLENLTGHRVFDRTSRSLRLTAEGERLLVAARAMLDLNDATVRGLAGPAVTGRLRLGISEDFIPRQLPRLLGRFMRLHPGAYLELRTGLSCDLLEGFDAGTLDVVIAKKDGSAQRGRTIWHEALIWLAAADWQPSPSQPVPLVLLRAPCTYRKLMLDSLDAARRSWVAACTASSLMGVQAAVAGGLGVSILGRSFVAEGLRTLTAADGWPPLPATEIVVVGEDTAPPDLIRPLVRFLTDWLGAGSA